MSLENIIPKLSPEGQEKVKAALSLGIDVQYTSLLEMAAFKRVHGKALSASIGCELVILPHFDYEVVRDAMVPGVTVKDAKEKITTPRRRRKKRQPISKLKLHRSSLLWRKYHLENVLTAAVLRTLKDGRKRRKPMPEWRDNEILTFVARQHPRHVRPREDRWLSEQQWVILILLYGRYHKSAPAIAKFLCWRRSTVERRIERIHLAMKGLRQDGKPHTGRPRGRPKKPEQIIDGS
jgi:hypothetical protein